MRLLHLAAPAAVVAAALVGCATDDASHAPGATAAPVAMTPEALNKLAMHQASDTFGVIGGPESTEKTATGTLYTWHAKVNGSVYVPTPAMTAGFIGNVPAGNDHSSSGQTYDHEVICRVRISAGKTGLIEHLDFNGPHSACDPVSHRLANWVNAAS